MSYNTNVLVVWLPINKYDIKEVLNMDADTKIKLLDLITIIMKSELTNEIEYSKELIITTDNRKYIIKAIRGE